MGNEKSVSLDNSGDRKTEKQLGKRPMLDTLMDCCNGVLSNNDNSITNFNSVLDSTKVPHNSLSDNVMEIGVAERDVPSSTADSSFNAHNFGEIKAHSNPAFEGIEGTIVPVSKGILDPSRHSTVRFEDNSHPKKSRNLNEGIPVARTRKNRGRDLSTRTNRVASAALRGRGSRFKTSGNLRSSLAESKEACVKQDLAPNLSFVDNVISNAPTEIVDIDTVSRY